MKESGRPQPNVAELVRQLRAEEKLSQRELAKIMGTEQPAIARLESDGYNGHSLSMLRRIAAALDRDLIIAFSRKKNVGNPIERASQKSDD